MSSAQESNIRYVCVGLTDVGRVREHNEDNFLVAQLTTAKRGASGEVFQGPMQQRGLALIVADGMGGAAAGEVASQMAVDTLNAELGAADLGGTVRSEQNVIALLEGAINKANEAIFKKGQESKDHQGMGTTMTAAVVLGDSLYLSQVGDSRGYLLRKGKLVQMTRDQSLIGQLIEEGTLTEEQAEKLGGKNIILQALGVEESLKIDSKRYDILRGDTLLLCSDGLSGMAPDAKLEEILASEQDLAKAARMLIDAANAGGGKDNITCILARFEGEGLREPLSPLTDAEKAGGTFRAPPPPKSRAGRNAIIATGAILAVIGAVLFRPQPVTLRVSVAGPKSGTVTVTPAKQGGPEGWTAEPVPFTAGTPVSIPLPRGKLFDVKVESPGYKADTHPDVTTKIDHNEINETFTLVRTPASSADFVPPRYRGKALSKVKVLPKPKEGQNAGDKAVDVSDSPTPEYASEFPAGMWEALVSRVGFQDVTTKEFEAKSAEPLVVVLPDMIEEFGQVDVKDLPPGAEVTFLEGDEVLSEKPAVVLATRSTGPVDVRATEVVVKVVCKGYEFPPVRQVVKKGESVAVSLADTKASVSFKGPEGAELKGDIPGKPRSNVLFTFTAVGKSVKTVDPGTYRLKYIAPDGTESPPYDLVVEPGRILHELDAATGK